MNVISLYAGLLGLIYLALSFVVVANRRKLKIGLGDNGDLQMQQSVRAHANFIEYVPICLILLVLLVNKDISVWLLHILGASLVIARIFHAQGILSNQGVSFGRFWGTCITWLVLLVASLLNIYLFVA